MCIDNSEKDMSWHENISTEKALFSGVCVSFLKSSDSKICLIMKNKKLWKGKNNMSLM